MKRIVLKISRVTVGTKHAGCGNKQLVPASYRPNDDHAVRESFRKAAIPTVTPRLVWLRKFALDGALHSIVLNYPSVLVTFVER
jgi:hypothetical protein